MRKYLYLILAITTIACQPKPTGETKDETITAVDNTQVETPVETVDSVLNTINEKIRADINNIDLYLERADYFMENEEPKAAMLDINRAFKMDTAYLPTLLKQADFLIRSGKLEISERVIQKMDQLHPNNSDVQVRFSKLYLVARNNTRSIQYADLAIKYNKYNAEAYYLKGYNFLETGDTMTSISSYQTAVEQNPEYFDAYLELGLIYSELDNPLALAYFENALEIIPDERRVLYSKGMYEQEHELYNEALQTYTTAIKAHPDFKEAHYNMGYVHLFYLQLYRESHKFFTDAIAVDPKYKEAYYNRGYAFELLGDINNAAKDYRKALEVAPAYDLAAKGLSRVNN